MRKQPILKKTVSWLFGENAGRVSFGLWNWLWGKSIASGGAVSMAVADEAFADMQRSVDQLTSAVAKMTVTHRKIQGKYEAKKQEFQEMERQAQIAIQQDQDTIARIAMSKAIMIEKDLLPSLKENMLAVEKILIENREKLQQEQQRLENHRNGLENSKTLAEFNEALQSIQNIHNELDITSAQSQFNSATNAIENKYIEVTVKEELAQGSHSKAIRDFTDQILESEITERLKDLNGLSLSNSSLTTDEL
jgi:phage shock protein A